MGKAKCLGFAATVCEGWTEPLLLLGEDYSKQSRAVVHNNNLKKIKFFYLFKVVPFNLPIFNKNNGQLVLWHFLLNKMPTVCISLEKTSSKKGGKMKWFLRP